jgi:hypothetical protein
MTSIPPRLAQVLAQSMVSAWWDHEDLGRGWEYWIACAGLLSSLLG